VAQPFQQRRHQELLKITEMSPDRFLDVMDANVTQSWLIARAAGRKMLAQGDGGKSF
jgi:NAD(P)-dependent dehydrogenase (short-subunit alcohol dehydrogenase family)